MAELELQVGDVVEVLDFRGSTDSPSWVYQMDSTVGGTYTVSSVASSNIPKCASLGTGYAYNQKWLKLIKKKDGTLISTKNMTSLIEKAKLAYKKEPEKSFIKAGIKNMSGDLTPDGEKVFMQFLFKQNETEFKKEVVDPILEEMKEESK